MQVTLNHFVSITKKKVTIVPLKCGDLLWEDLLLQFLLTTVIPITKHIQINKTNTKLYNNYLIINHRLESFCILCQLLLLFERHLQFVAWIKSSSFISVFPLLWHEFPSHIAHKHTHTHVLFVCVFRLNLHLPFRI